MGMNKSTIVAISFAVLAVIIAALWLYDSSIFDPLTSYLNERGGWFAMLFVFAVIATWAFALIAKRITPLVLLPAIFVTILLLIALFIPADVLMIGSEAATATP